MFKGVALRTDGTDERRACRGVGGPSFPWAQLATIPCPPCSVCVWWLARCVCVPVCGCVSCRISALVPSWGAGALLFGLRANARFGAVWLLSLRCAPRAWARGTPDAILSAAATAARKDLGGVRSVSGLLGWCVRSVSGVLVGGSELSDSARTDMFRSGSASRGAGGFGPGVARATFVLQASYETRFGPKRTGRIQDASWLLSQPCSTTPAVALSGRLRVPLESTPPRRMAPRLVGFHAGSGFCRYDKAISWYWF